MYLVINKWVIAFNVSNFSGQYLLNHWTLGIGVLGYIGIVWPKEHSPEVWSVPPVKPCIWRGRPTWRRAPIFRHYDSCLQTFGRTPWTDGWTIARTLPTPHNTNIAWLVFEPTIPRSKRHKTAHILDRTTNVIWNTYYHKVNHVWSDW